MTELLALIFKEWRYEQRLSLRDCAALTGLSNPYLCQFENGKSGITLDNAVKIFSLVMATKITFNANQAVGKKDE